MKKLSKDTEKLKDLHISCFLYPCIVEVRILEKIMLPLEAKFVQQQTYALYRDLKVMSGASPNQIKPLHVISGDKLKRFFFGLLQS